MLREAAYGLGRGSRLGLYVPLALKEVASFSRDFRRSSLPHSSGANGCVTSSIAPCPIHVFSLTGITSALDLRVASLHLEAPTFKALFLPECSPACPVPLPSPAGLMTRLL